MLCTPAMNRTDHDQRTGGVEGDRTLDLGIANAALSHLSYHPGERGFYRARGPLNNGL